MTVGEVLLRTREVRIPPAGPLVFHTAGRELAARSGAPVVAGPAEPGGTMPGCFELALDPGTTPAGRVTVALAPDGSGRLAVSHPHFLFAAVRYLLDALAPRDLDALDGGLALTPAFDWNRSCYDVFLTQEARLQHGLDPDTYVRRLAESGFTHIEVNSLAFPMGLETGPKGEAYPMFYTYCPALDQFACSRLNKGVYPAYYLSANLARLKRNAALARRYGLVPGLLCFEPRSVPEEFFARYPMLRGARVDHPFRSFKPRYTMTLAHPAVLEHYAEMLQAILAEVPELAFLDVWTNDSGSGFEHTTSLYVGRNGGPYMIREWTDHAEIARVAGHHVLGFFRTLRDAARELNPAFRIITRLESFMGEHDTVWGGLEEGLEVETTSLVARGWEMPYRHPRYPDSSAVNGGSVYQLAFDAEEGARLADLEARGSAAHFFFSAGPHQMFAPLLGVPYPRLTWRRLRLLFDHGVRALSQIGGTFPPELVPFNPNHEMLRRFQFDPALDPDAEVAALALRWAGEAFAPALVRAWALAEEAILGFPNITPLYSTIGFTWYRLWVRPLVPNIEAIPRVERAYYEDFMCTTPHNPNNVDLSRDVLFRLAAPDQCRRDVERMDANVWEPLDEAIRTLDAAGVEAACALGARNVIADQAVRLRALRCWLTTERDVGAWIASVYGWMAASTEAGRTAERARLDEAIRREIDNTGELRALLETGVEVLATTDLGETPLMHGRNLAGLLDRREALMRRHAGDDPFIDHGYMMRVAGRPLE